MQVFSCCVLYVKCIICKVYYLYSKFIKNNTLDLYLPDPIEENIRIKILMQKHFSNSTLSMRTYKVNVCVHVYVCVGVYVCLVVHYKSYMAGMYSWLTPAKIHITI